MRPSWLSTLPFALLGAGFAQPAYAASAPVELLGEASAGGSIRIRVTPPTAPRAPLRVGSSAGSAGDLVETGKGSWEATLSLPQGTGPSRAVLVVWEDTRDGWVEGLEFAIADELRGKVHLNRRDPLFARHGSHRAGPFHTDGKGDLSWSVPADPAAGSAPAQLETAQGKAVQPLPWSAAPARPVVVGRPSALRPGESAELFPWPATAVAGFAPGSLRVRSLLGTARPQPDAATPRFTFQAPTPFDDAAVVELLGPNGQPLGSSSFLPASLPAATLTLSPLAPVAPGATVPVSLELKDAQGRPTDVDVLLTASAGELTRPISGGPGRRVARWTAPLELPASGTVRLSARVTWAAAGEAPAHAELDVPIELDPAQRVVAEVPAEVAAGSVQRFEFQTLTTAGGPGRVDRPSVVASSGSVLGVEPVGAGRWQLRWQAPSELGEVAFRVDGGKGQLSGGWGTNVVASVGGEAGETAEPRGFVGAFAGLSTNLGSVATVQGSAVLLARVAGWLRVGADVGVDVPRSVTVAGNAGAPEATLQVARIPLHARLGVGTRLGAVELWAGGAAGVARLQGSLKVPGHADVRLDAFRPDVGGHVGLGLPLGPGLLALEGRHTWAPVKVTTADGITVHGSAGGLEVALGYGISF